MPGTDILTQRPEDVFVGRTSELDTLVRSVDSAAAGTSALVLVRGDAGIGKSTLVTRGLLALRDRGWRVLHVRSDDLDRRVPYAALAHAIVADESLLSVAGRPLVAEAVEALDMAARTSVSAVHGAAIRLVSALRDAAPTVLAFDDLRLVDEDTIVLVANLFRRPERHALVVVGAVRTAEDLAAGAITPLADRAGTDGVLHHVDIGPLGPDELTELLAMVLQHPPDPSLVSLLAQQSGGNPFFAVQTLLDLVEREALAVSDGRFRLTDASPPLSEDRSVALLNRVLRVGAEARRLLRALALLGPAPIAHLHIAAELSSLTSSDAHAAFDVLVGRGILERDGDMYRFGHLLVRDALYQEIGPAERWRWHKVAAVRLASLPSSPKIDQEIARHVRETADVGDESAIEILASAADRACVAAPHSAIPWYQAALRITPAEQPRHAEIAARLARANLLAGRSREAAEAGASALERLPAGPLRARVVTLVVESLAKIGAVDEAEKVVDGERAAEPSLRRAAQAAHIYAVAGRTEDARTAAAEAMAALGSATAYERLAAVVDLVQMCCLAGFSRLDQLVPELRSLATEAPPALALNAYATMGYALAMRGETRACSEATRRAQQLLGEYGWGLYRAELAVAQVQNLFNLGDWDGALLIVDAVISEAGVAASSAFLDVLRCLRAVVHAHRGEWAPARRAVQYSPPPHPVYAALRATAESELVLLSNDLDRARTLLETHRRHIAVPLQIQTVLISQMIDVELEAGNDGAALDLLAEIDAVGKTELDHPTRLRCELARGRAAHEPEVLASVLPLAEEHRLALVQAQARLYLGSMGVDPEANLHAAIRGFQALGAAPWRRRAAAQLRQRSLPVPRHRPAPSTFLTETEAQIARLVQLGRPNREIAATVSLSVKTVEGYLSRIYAKTGCTSRLELARALDDGLGI